MENPNVVKIKKKMNGIMTAIAYMQHTFDGSYRVINSIKTRINASDVNSQKIINEFNLYIQQNKLDLQEDYSSIIDINNTLNSKNLVDDEQASKLFDQAKAAFEKLQKFTSNALSTLTAFQRQLSALEPISPPARQTIAASIPQSSDNATFDEAWLVQENVEKVIKTLENFKSADTTQLANLLRKNYKDLKNSTKEQRPALLTFIKSVMLMPGYGYVMPANRSKMNDFEIQYIMANAHKAIEEANIHGTEQITSKFLKGFNKSLVVNYHEKAKARKTKSREMKIIMPYGPPGTGKSTIAKALAKACGKQNKFFRIAMDTKKDPMEIYGCTEKWAGGAKLGIIGEAMVTLGCDDPFIFLDELDKASPEILMSLGELLGTQPSYQDTFLNTNIDTCKVTFFAAANNIKLLPPHLVSRLQPIYFAGYSDEQKVNILSTMALEEFISTKDIGAMGLVDDSKFSLHIRKVLELNKSPAENGFKSNENAVVIVNNTAYFIEDGKWVLENNKLKRASVNFDENKFNITQSGLVDKTNDNNVDEIIYEALSKANLSKLVMSPEANDAIEFIVENYITEAGVREAEGILDSVFEHLLGKRMPGQQINFDRELVLESLGPIGNIKKIKELKKQIGHEEKNFADIVSEIYKAMPAIIEKKVLSDDEQITSRKLIEKLNNSADKLIPMEETLIGLLNDSDQLTSQVESHEKNIKIIENGIDKFSKWIEKIINNGKLRDDDSSFVNANASQEETKIKKDDNKTIPPITVSNDETNKKIAEMEEKIKLLQNLLSFQTVHNPSQSITEEQRKEFESARNELANLHRELVIELKLLKTQNAPSSIAESGIINPLLQSKLQYIDDLQHQVTELNTLVQQALTAAKQTPVISTSTMFNPNMEGNNNAFLEQRLSIAEDRISDLKKLLAQGNVSNFPQMISEFPFSDNFINSSEHSPEMDELFKINRRLDTEIQQLRENGRPADKSNVLLLQKVLNEKLNEIEQLRQKLLEKDEELLQQKDKTHQENQIYIDTTDESEIDERNNHSEYLNSDDNEEPYVVPRQSRRLLSTQQKTPSQIKVSTKPPITTRHVPTPQEATTFGARVGKMQLGYDIIKMLEKKSRKEPAVVVAAAFNKKELLNKFNEFCESVSEKIERYNDDELVGAVQQLNDIIQSKPNEAEKEKILAKKLNTEKLGPLLYRDPDKNTENPLQRFENKTNSVAVYNGLQAKRDPENKLTILKPDDDYPEPIVTISHEKPIDGPNFVEIICANTYPEDRDIFVTINSARKLSKDGRFTVVGCDHPPNPDTAMKLFIYGLSIGLKPRLLPATRKMIEEKRGDKHLFKIFIKHQDEGLGVVSQNVRNAIVEDLKTYDNQNKKVVLRKL